MTTAVDTNVLLDILAPASPFFEDSYAGLRSNLADGLIVSEVVLAELASEFSDDSEILRFLQSVEVSLVRSATEALYMAGASFQRYSQRRRSFKCAECGAKYDVPCPGCGAKVTGRQHILLDFMIGAHAQVHAGRLLTRDLGYYGTYFPDLVLV